MDHAPRTLVPTITSQCVLVVASCVLLQHHPQASPAEVKAALLQAAVVKIQPGATGGPLLPLLDVGRSTLRSGAPTA